MSDQNGITVAVDVAALPNPYPVNSHPYLQFELKRTQYAKYVESAQKCTMWLVARSTGASLVAPNDAFTAAVPSLAPEILKEAKKGKS